MQNQAAHMLSGKVLEAGWKVLNKITTNQKYCVTYVSILNCGILFNVNG